MHIHMQEFALINYLKKYKSKILLEEHNFLNTNFINFMKKINFLKYLEKYYTFSFIIR